MNVTVDYLGNLARVDAGLARTDAQIKTNLPEPVPALQ